jgi:hypothetical protein
VVRGPEKWGNIPSENSTTGDVKTEPLRCWLRGVPLLERREKWGAPFFFSTNPTSAGYTNTDGGHPPTRHLKTTRSSGILVHAFSPRTRIPESIRVSEHFREFPMSFNSGAGLAFALRPSQFPFLVCSLNGSWSNFSGMNDDPQNGNSHHNFAIRSTSCQSQRVRDWPLCCW